MSTEDERRARRARAARSAVGEGVPEQVPGQQPLELETPTQRPLEVVRVTVLDEPPLDAPAADVVEVELDPLTGDDAPKITESGDGDATVRDDAEDVPQVGDGEAVLVEGDRPVVDHGKAAGELVRRDRQQRGTKGTQHGHGWLEVEAFTEHLRTARLRPLGTGQGTVNVRVSAPLVEALEAYRGEVDVSKRDVVEALLVELLGPPAGEGGRR